MSGDPIGPAEPAGLAARVEALDAVRERTRAALAGVDRVVVVASGKGGVGKSAVAVNLAASIAERGLRTGLLDADLHGPSVAKMLGLRGQPLRIGADERLRPVPGPVGLAVQSMDFFLQGGQALDWDGPAGEGALWRSALEHAALGDLIGRTAWGALDCLVVDLAPGSDRLPALSSLVPGALAALAVTIPTEVASLAVGRSLARAREARIPVIGLVENFASAVCSACGAEGPLFREVPAETLAAELGVPLVGRIPFDAALADAADAGVPYATGPGAGTPARRALAELADRVLSYAPPEEDGR